MGVRDMMRKASLIPRRKSSIPREHGLLGPRPLRMTPMEAKVEKFLSPDGPLMPQATAEGAAAAPPKKARKATVRFAVDVDVQTINGEDDSKIGRKWIEDIEQNEYVREAKFFKKVAKWAHRSRRVEDSYEAEAVVAFLPPARAAAAEELCMVRYADLVKKCGRYVNKHMYLPSADEVAKDVVRAQTEEILTSLVRDWLLEHFVYDIEIEEERNSLYHDCFHLSRSISWRRQQYIESNLLS